MSVIQVPENTGSFLTGCIRLYEEMMNDIKLCRRKELERLEEIQCCFEIANNYIGKLVKDAGAYIFESEKDEILFFKKIKPLFTSEAEYFTYYYHAEIFKSTVEDNCALELELFFRRQLQRRNKFSRDHSVFYKYMEDGKTENDTDWFKRSASDTATCLYDKPMAVYLAIQKYEHYIGEELKAIGADQTLPENEERNNL